MGGLFDYGDVEKGGLESLGMAKQKNSGIRRSWDFVLIHFHPITTKKGVTDQRRIQDLQIRGAQREVV